MVSDEKTGLRVLTFPKAPETPPAPASVANDILKEVPEGMDTVVVVGWDKDGNFYLRSSEPSGPEVMWLLEQAKFALVYTARVLSAE